MGKCRSDLLVTNFVAQDAWQWITENLRGRWTLAMVR